ncbi:MAG: hypothetical protein HDR80_11360 [Bacteroides sp.]|nr:hypothetical protein [Bacteroides sp.]
MKNLFITCGLAAAIALSASAENDKLQVIRSGSVTQQYLLEHIKKMHYTGDADGYTHINIVDKDGNPVQIRLDRVSELSIKEGLPESPVKAKIIPHFNCATLEIECPDTDENGNPISYRTSGMPTNWLKGMDPSVWADYLVEDDIIFLKDWAVQAGTTLGPKDVYRLCEHGNQKRDWWASEEIGMGTPLTVVFYTLGIGEDGSMYTTTEPLLVETTTLVRPDGGYPVNFKIDYETTSTTVDVKFTPEAAEEGADTDINYISCLISASDFLQYETFDGLMTALLNSALASYNRGVEWDDLAPIGVSSRRRTNCRPGDFYVTFAFGADRGIQTTVPFYIEIIEVPVATVTDDTTFEFSAKQVNAAEMNVTIKPSTDKPYTVYIVPASSIKGFIEDFGSMEVAKVDENGNPVLDADGNPVMVTVSYAEADPSVRPYVGEQWAADKVYYARATNNLERDIIPFTYTGEQTLTTYNQMCGGDLLQADTDYYVMACVYDEEYRQVSVMGHQLIRTDSSALEKISFEVDFDNFEYNEDPEDDYYRYITAHIKPSKDDARYVYHILHATSAYCNLSYDDEKIVKDLVDVQGFSDKYGLKNTTGDLDWRATCARPVIPEFNPETGEYEYNYPVERIMIFGYDGKLTSDLYVYEVNFTTGEWKYVRGPGCTTPAEK